MLEMEGKKSLIDGFVPFLVILGAAIALYFPFGWYMQWLIPLQDHPAFGVLVSFVALASMGLFASLFLSTLWFLLGQRQFIFWTSLFIAICAFLFVISVFVVHPEDPGNVMAFVWIGIAPFIVGLAFALGVPGLLIRQKYLSKSR